MRIALGPQLKRRGWAAPMALVVLLGALFLGTEAGKAPAQSLQERLDRKQGQLDEVMDRKEVVTTEISRFSGRIDRLEGEVAALRNREADGAGAPRRQGGAAAARRGGAASARRSTCWSCART